VRSLPGDWRTFVAEWITPWNAEPFSTLSFCHCRRPKLYRGLCVSQSEKSCIFARLRPELAFATDALSPVLEAHRARRVSARNHEPFGKQGSYAHAQKNKRTPFLESPHDGPPVSFRKGLPYPLPIRRRVA